jgi:hypothetical protein
VCGGEWSRLLGNEKSAEYQKFAGEYRSFRVHVENVNRDSADRRSTDEPGPDPSKMSGPIVTARVVERRQSAALGVVARNVRTLMTVAVKTGEGKIAEIGRAAVLAGDDVIDRKRLRRIAGLRHPAVFAGVTGPLANGLDEMGGDPHSGPGLRRPFPGQMAE